MFGPSISAAYGIEALGCLARAPGRWTRAETIASATGVPTPYLVKLLHGLSRRGLVATKRGYRGGYRLGREAGEITVFEIIAAVDGEQVFDRCLLGRGRCSPRVGCALHPTWSAQRERIVRRLRELTLAELAAGQDGDGERDYRFGIGHGQRIRV